MPKRSRLQKWKAIEAATTIEELSEIELEIADEDKFDGLMNLRVKLNNRLQELTR